MREKYDVKFGDVCSGAGRTDLRYFILAGERDKYGKMLYDVVCLNPLPSMEYGDFMFFDDVHEDSLVLEESDEVR